MQKIKETSAKKSIKRKSRILYFTTKGKFTSKRVYKSLKSRGLKPTKKKIYVTIKPTEKQVKPVKAKRTTRPRPTRKKKILIPAIFKDASFDVSVPEFDEVQQIDTTRQPVSEDFDMDELDDIDHYELIST